MFWFLTISWSMILWAGCWGLFKVWWPGHRHGLGVGVAFALLSQGQLHWSDAPEAAWWAWLAAGCLSWKYATRPRSPGPVDLADWERWGLLACLLLLPGNPGWLAPHLCLVSRRRRLVAPSLHERLPIHLCSVLLCHFALSAAAPLGRGEPARLALWSACLAIVAALYAWPGVAKLRIGQRWFSWILNVRLHYQLIGAYCWGWWQGCPFPKLATWARRLGRLNRWLAALTVALELGVLALPLDPTLARLNLLGLALFHTAYLAMTGAFFWENILLLLGAAACLPGAPPGFFSLPSALLFLVSVRVYVEIFKTDGLTWWELPLVQRVYTEVVCAGQRLALTHAWLDPLERRHYIGPEELSPFQLWTHNLTHSDLNQSTVEDLLQSPSSLHPPARTPEPADIEAARLQFQAMLPALERRREVVPAWLRAPRSYLAPGSRGACYQGQGRIEEIWIRYEELHFDEQRLELHLKRDEPVVGWRRVDHPEQPGQCLLVAQVAKP
jgi:hypothetical protein